MCGMWSLHMRYSDHNSKMLFFEDVLLYKNTGMLHNLNLNVIKGYRFYYGEYVLKYKEEQFMSLCNAVMYL